MSYPCLQTPSGSNENKLLTVPQITFDSRIAFQNQQPSEQEPCLPPTFRILPRYVVCNMCLLINQPAFVLCLYFL